MSAIADTSLKIEYEVYNKSVTDKLHSIKNEGLCNDLFRVTVNTTSALQKNPITAKSMPIGRTP